MAVFDMVFCPALLCGGETWTLDSREYGGVQAAEMKCLRRVVGKTERDRIRNATIRDQAKAVDIRTEMEVDQLGWFGRVEGMSDERIAKSVCNAGAQGGRPGGRPRRRWDGDIEEALQKRNLSFIEGSGKCQNREDWRKIISGTITLYTEGKMG